jgi:hypothetical protein
MVFAKLDDCN